jgi:membrane-associated phospholipid phosphatase
MQRFLAWDAQFSARLRVAERPGTLRTLAVLLAHSGDSWFWLLGLAVVWLVGSPAWKHLALVLGAGILITALLVMVVKFTVRRRRPEGEWGEIYRSTDPHSFPSGHAARAVMLAVVAVGLAPVWFAAALVIWAPLVCLARVAMGVHYFSDVLAGIIFGLLAGGVVLILF